MEKCIYNGKTLYAYEVLQNFEFEKVIRKCPTLICCDCGASVFFRHGKQRTECFVHKHKEECRYGDYCRKQSEIFKHAQRELTVHLQRIAEQHNYQLEEDVMIIPAHYTAFVLRSVSVSYAIDIIDSAATTATLEKHKNMYLQKGYQYLQITVDKNAEHESFSERTMAYLPVKFALNESLNHTALVIDKEYRTWSIYILDKTNISTEYELMPYVLYNDTFAMSISLDDLNINNLGFYTASSNDAYNSFCQTRKQAYVEWTHEQEKILKQTQIEMENEHKRAEQQRLEKERITVEIRVQRQQAEAAKKKAEEDQMLIGAILNVLNSVIANPSLLESSAESSTYAPSGDVVRQQNEIRHMMDSTQLDYDRTKSEILRLAQMQYDCCTYSDKPQQTELLRNLLVGHEQLNSLGIGLLKSCVSRIWVSHFCTIEIELINGTIIHNITERSTSHGNGNECNSDSCETADSK